MTIHEVDWIRTYSHKFCPSLRRSALEWYKPAKRLPCIFQGTYKGAKQRLKKLPIIVQLEDAGTRECTPRSVAEKAGCSLKKELALINAFSTSVNARSLEKLVRDTNVKRIWYDGEIRAVLDTATKTTCSADLWAAEVTGRGVTVAVLDTGIYDHPDLTGRIAAFKDLVGQKTKPYDDNGHGTHVAGDIASDGAQSGRRFKGPAPEAKLVGVKVLNKMGSGSLSTVIKGVEWCINNKDTYGIRVLNLSLGSDATLSYKNDPVCQAVEKAWKAGLVVCVAAGNSGPEVGTINSPGTHPDVITVGALNDIDPEQPGGSIVADFSSRGPTKDGLIKPDVLSPGVGIVSLRSPNSNLDKQRKDTRTEEWYTTLSGTSMATPICAGIVTQMLQAEPSLTPGQVKERLMKTAKAYPGLDANSQGAGLINARAAVNEIEKDV
ncbi:MAG TPA: S8 family peptidase [Clostridia bacterium]|nr:S8 family peptidase [Clostridia bacterium]